MSRCPSPLSNSSRVYFQVCFLNPAPGPSRPPAATQLRAPLGAPRGRPQPPSGKAQSARLLGAEHLAQASPRPPAGYRCRPPPPQAQPPGGNRCTMSSTRDPGRPHGQQPELRYVTQPFSPRSRQAPSRSPLSPLPLPPFLLTAAGGRIKNLKKLKNKK